MRDILSWTCNLEIDNWFPTPQTIVSKGDTKKHKKARKTHQHVRNCIGKERTRNQKETSGNVRNCRGQATVKRLNEKCQALEAAKPKVPCVPWKGDFWSPRMSEEHGKWESLGFLGGFMGIIVYLWKWWETTNMLTIIEGFQGTVWKDFWNLCWDRYPNMRWNHPPNKWDFQQTKHGTWRHSQRRRYQDLHRPSNARRFQLISGRI